MIYITFDRNILKGLIACGVSKTYYVNHDYSIFHIGDECFLHGVSAGGAPPGESVSARELTDDSVTILYSFCPFEICGAFKQYTRSVLDAPGVCMRFILFYSSRRAQSSYASGPNLAMPMQSVPRLTAVAAET